MRRPASRCAQRRKKGATSGRSRARVRAALITELGRPPTVGEAPEPAGTSLEVLAAPLNPLDRAVAAGKFYGGHPPAARSCRAASASGARPAGRSSGPSAAGSGSPATARWPSGRSRERSSPRCRTAPTRPSRRRSVSPGSPAGCRSRGVRRSGRTTACSCSARPAPSGRSRFRRHGSSARPASLRPAATRSGSSGRSSSAPTRRCPSTATSASRPTSSTRSAASRSSEPSPPPRRERGSSSSASRRGRLPRFRRPRSAASSSSCTASRTSPCPRTCSRSTTRGSSGHALAGEIQVDVERVGLDEIGEAWDRPGKLVVIPG